jgi:hypothetical protein
MQEVSGTRASVKTGPSRVFWQTFRMGLAGIWAILGKMGDGLLWVIRWVLHIPPGEDSQSTNL